MIPLRGIAIAIALLAIWDPAMQASRSIGVPVDLVVAVSARRAAAAADLEARLVRELEAGGFRVNSGDVPVARVAIADRRPTDLGTGVPVWAIDMTEHRTPNVAIRRPSATAARPGQSAEVRVVVDGVGVTGGTTEIRLEHHGIVVATIRHTWQTATEAWTAILHYLPPADVREPLTVRAVGPDGEVTADDNVAEVRLPAARPPLRVLTYDASVTWGSVFARRSLEGESAFALSGVQRASQGVATRAGEPPAALSAATLASYDAVIVGSPEDLSGSDVAALRWFIEERGGVTALVPQRRAAAAYRALIGVDAFEERVLERPAILETSASERLQAAEFLVCRELPVTARALATAGKAAEPVVFVSRRGAGAALFFGALDAWRYRAADRDAFARFWRRSLLEAASTVAPRLAVDVVPDLARPGDAVTIQARLRPTDIRDGSSTFAPGPIAARAIAPARKIDEPIRLWPRAEPGVFEGTWRIPAAGSYDVTVSRGDLRADTTFIAADAINTGSEDDRDGLERLARGSGGDLRMADEVSALVAALRARFPPEQTAVRTHPMRSPWWMLPFAAALCMDWTRRRVRGER